MIEAQRVDERRTPGFDGKPLNKIELNFQTLHRTQAQVRNPCPFGLNDLSDMKSFLKQKQSRNGPWKETTPFQGFHSWKTG